MSSGGREKYPQKIVETFIEPMCQMQGNHRCLIPNPCQGLAPSLLKIPRQKPPPPREPDRWLLCSSPLSRFWRSRPWLGWSVGWLEGWASCAHWVCSQCWGLRASWLKAHGVSSMQRLSFSLRTHRLFLTAGTKTSCCSPASHQSVGS